MIIFFVPPLISFINSKNLPNGSDIAKLIIVLIAGIIFFVPINGYFIHYVCILFEKIKKRKSNKMTYPKHQITEKKKEKNELSIEDDAKTIDITLYSDGYESTVSENTCDLTVVDYTKNDNGLKSNETLVDEVISTKEKTNFNWKSSATPSKYNFITYIIIYAFSWIPATIWGITQPIHIAVNVLSFFVGLCVPDKIRIILHPLVTCTFLSYFLFWIQGLIFGRSLKEEVDLYSNNSKYLLYLNDTTLPFPKAGELLFCILDSTVVALSFKILEHHKLILKHIVELVGSIIIMSFLSMLLNTTLCSILGITPEYALSMTSRNATSPLAIQIVNYLGSDMAVAVVIVSFTGVFTDIFGLPVLKLLRFPFKDSLAHGACMGCSGHTVATAGLIKDYPSASAVSSISFVLFSTMCVVWAAITPIANLFRSIAGKN